MKKDKITISEIERLAELSALEFTDAEKENLVGEVSGILEMLNACGEVETEELKYKNVHKIDDLRDDEVASSLPQDVALKNAPKQRKGYFNVPKVVE